MRRFKTTIEIRYLQEKDDKVMKQIRKLCNDLEELDVFVEENDVKTEAIK
jgi:hypothetical protein